MSPSRGVAPGRQAERTLTRPELTAALAARQMLLERHAHALAPAEAIRRLTPLQGQDSHILTSMLGIDALALVPEDRDAIAAGEPVEIEFVA